MKQISWLRIQNPKLKLIVRRSVCVSTLSLLIADLATGAFGQTARNLPSALRSPLALSEQEVTASDGTVNSFFGSSAAIKGDTALIGADGDNSFQGAAYFFTETAGLWVQQQKITAGDGLAGDEFGYRVALGENTAVVGAFSATVNGVVSQGSAYVFTNSGSGTWSQSQKLTASDGGLFDDFGASVALQGDLIVVGANGATVDGNPAQGAAYVFARTNGTWSQVQKLVASDGAAYDNFGLSITLDGTTILVGAPQASINGNFAQGAVYVFSLSNGTWTQTQKLTANDGAAGASFGQSLASSRDTALVGAYGATVNSHSGQGAAYTFTRANGVLTQMQKLTASDGAAGANFGNAVALHGTKALIGADVSTVGSSTSAGKAYLFTEAGGNWTQLDILTASDSATDDFFGAAVALSSNTALVSTPHPEFNGNTFQGAAYFFSQSPGSP